MSYRITTTTGHSEIVQIDDREELTTVSGGPELFGEPPAAPEPTEHVIPIPFVPLSW